MDFRIERDGEDLSITYLDFGEWYPVPAKYKLAEEVAALLELVKNKKRRRYELSICSAGIVSIARDRELVLVLERAAQFELSVGQGEPISWPPCQRADADSPFFLKIFSRGTSLSC